MLMLIFLYLPVICSICMYLVIFPRLSSTIASSAQGATQSLSARPTGLGSLQ